MARGSSADHPKHTCTLRDGRDQAHPLAPWAQAVSAHPTRADNAELRHLTEPSGGTDDAEGPINHYPAWQLVRIGRSQLR